MKRIFDRFEVFRQLLFSAARLADLAVAIMLVFVIAVPSKAGSQTKNAAAPVYEYEVISVKPSKSENGGGGRTRTLDSPDGYTATNTPVMTLIQYAYGIFDNERISGAPGWIASERYDIDAKMDGSVADALQKLNQNDRTLARQQMLQTLLADRFKLTVHRETKELPIYALVIAKNGSKLKEAKPGDAYANGFKNPTGGASAGMLIMGMNGTAMTMTGQAVPIADLVRLLAGQVGRTVVDNTGLNGNFDFSMQFTPEQAGLQASSGLQVSGGTSPNGTPPLSTSDTAGPSLFTAVQEQLGLKLEPRKGPVGIIVIDHIERALGN